MSARGINAVVRLLAAAVFLMSCSRPPEDPRSWRIGGEQRTLADRTAQDSLLVLLVAPADCFACSTVYTNWLEVRQRGALRTLLLLSQAPTSREEPLLALARIRWDGIVASSRLQRPGRTPRLVLLHRDSVLHDQVITPGMESDVLRHLLDEARNPYRTASPQSDK